MRVVITWSGTRSSHVAQALHAWLPNVIQRLEPWMSQEDIQSGTRWEAEIAGVLEGSLAGIVCLTPENQSREWVNFEAGAISKAISEQTRLIPYLVDLSPEQLRGPLSHFLIARANEAGTRAMVESLNNALGDGRLPPERLSQAFDHWWPELEATLTRIPAATEVIPEARGQYELVAEILENTREILRRGDLASLNAIYATESESDLPRYVIFERSPGLYSWRIVDQRANTLAVSEQDYTSRDDALAAAAAVRDELRRVDIVEADDALT